MSRIPALFNSDSKLNLALATSAPEIIRLGEIGSVSYLREPARSKIYFTWQGIDLAISRHGGMIRLTGDKRYSASFTSMRALKESLAKIQSD